MKPPRDRRVDRAAAADTLGATAPLGNSTAALGNSTAAKSLR